MCWGLKWCFLQNLPPRDVKRKKPLQLIQTLLQDGNSGDEMRRSQQRLAIWMNGIPVGYWEKRKGEDRLEYLPEWIADTRACD